MARGWAICLLGVVATVSGGGVGWAESGPVTFYQDVLPIVQEKCQNCHRPNGANLGGMVAPMAFQSYRETRPWAKAVESRKMPPWHASPEQHGLFKNERTLSEDEIATIVSWARSGAKRSNPADAPEKKVWPDTRAWLIGEPDLIVRPDEAFYVEDGVEDLYVYLKTTMTDEMTYGYVSFINDSGDHEAFFDNLMGDNPDLVALVIAFDRDHDGMLTKAEAPEELGPYFAFLDSNKDGGIDRNETRAAMANSGSAQHASD